MSEIQAETVKINAYVEDKIGLPKYSSVTFGGSLTRVVPNGDDEYLKAELQHSFELVEEVLAGERAKVLDDLGDTASSD